MKRDPSLSIFLFIVSLLLYSVACSMDLGSLSNTGQSVDKGVSGAIPEPDEEIIPDSGEEDPDEESFAQEETAPEAMETPSPTPTVEIIHQTSPGDPASTSYYILDSSSAAYAPEQRSIADNFNINILERPFDADGMVYKAYLDIVRTELFISSPWVYITIFLEGAPPADAAAWYAAEIDLDMDGEGDVLVAGLLPPDSTWTTDGVMVFKDNNNDVAGSRVMLADSPPQTGDGYETLVFDQGIGDDPDAAWIRIAPGYTDRIQLSFKYRLINSDGEFLWASWTDEGLQEAAWFDYHDHFSHAEAGSPLSESSHYPLAAMDLMDNTCRWTYGFQPTDPLPGLCPLPVTLTPTPTLTPTTTTTPTQDLPSGVRGRVFIDADSSGSWTGVDSPFIGVPVHLWENSCGGSGHLTTITNSEGRYAFVGLEAGTYCVQVKRSDLPAGPWYNTLPGSALNDPTVIVSPPPGVALGAHFGFKPDLY